VWLYLTFKHVVMWTWYASLACLQSLAMACIHLFLRRTDTTTMESDLQFDPTTWFEDRLVEYNAANVLFEPSVPYGEAPRKRNAVVEETFELASKVMDYAERLVPVNMVFADQILRSGTSVGSHTREAQGAESLADFVHKMKIAHKELEETDYRLALCHVKAHYPHDDDLVRRARILIPLFHSILSTSRKRLNQQRSDGRRKRSGT